jgi:hypothetical protein
LPAIVAICSDGCKANKVNWRNCRWLQSNCIYNCHLSINIAYLRKKSRKERKDAKEQSDVAFSSHLILFLCDFA